MSTAIEQPREVIALKLFLELPYDYTYISFCLARMNDDYKAYDLLHTCARCGVEPIALINMNQTLKVYEN